MCFQHHCFARRHLPPICDPISLSPFFLDAVVPFPLPIAPAAAPAAAPAWRWHHRRHARRTELHVGGLAMWCMPHPPATKLLASRWDSADAAAVCPTSGRNAAATARVGANLCNPCPSGRPHCLLPRGLLLRGLLGGCDCLGQVHTASIIAPTFPRQRFQGRRPHQGGCRRRSQGRAWQCRGSNCWSVPADICCYRS